MKITTSKFDELKALSGEKLDNYRQPIKPLWKEWSDYGNAVVDYFTKEKSNVNRYMQPYITSQTHGVNVWDGLVELVADLKPLSIVDLGCGAGEFFTKIPDSIDKYGLTIHVGEVKYAREVFKLENVIPADMREVNKYFNSDSVDMVLAHRSFDFIDPKDRIDTMIDAYTILKPKGYFVYVDDERFAQSKMPAWDYSKYFRLYTPKKHYFAKGEMTILQKYV